VHAEAAVVTHSVKLENVARRKRLKAVGNVMNLKRAENWIL
jgi:hypothetical protein